ncbi:hypothetical protein [Paenibacillus sp. sgz500958]|uniref:hypothetical protein n=1 Tax=Paenibacillus sp. sgz500958 TaxID=3242475 RepID=UPI0036D41044
MQRQEIQKIIIENKQFKVHLISGETYIGRCELKGAAEDLSLLTETEEKFIPFWVIKRILIF